MSSVSDVASVSLLLADYAGIDQGGKLNVVGGGITWLGRLPGTDAAPAHALVLRVEVPSSHYGARAEVKVALEDDAGEPVRVTPHGAEPQEVVIKQSATFAAPKLPAGVEEAEASNANLPSHLQLVGAFPPGLPVQPGRTYRWRAFIDGETRDAWSIRFFATAATAGKTPQPA